MKNQVTANEDNTLKFRDGLYDPKKDKDKSKEMNESGTNDQAQSSGLQYFTE